MNTHAMTFKTTYHSKKSVEPIKSYEQCLQPYRNPTRNPGFFNKPNPNLTRNFKTQTQPKPEIENLTQPKKTGFILGCFLKKNF